MDKRIIFEFREGSFGQGFAVRLRLVEEGRSVAEISGSLPPDSAIPNLFEQWQSTYQRHDHARRLTAQPIVTNIDIHEYHRACNAAAHTLQQRFNLWLGQLQPPRMRDTILRQVKESEPVRVIVQTQHALLRRLPWHSWDLFEHNYRHAEIALSTENFDRRPLQPFKGKVRILAILGNSDDIDVEADRKILEHLPGAEAVFLVEPTRQQFNEALWDERGWQILFFAGHSASDGTGEIGHLQINRTEQLTIPDLRHALRHAIDRGLQLAMFNSCDGLGLAHNLADLHLPQMIVMREPVPDRVAQEFLKYFLTAFSRGSALSVAMRQAREQLQGLEGHYPCATWLPILCQNPTVEIPLTWPRRLSGRTLGYLAAGAAGIAILAGLTFCGKPFPVVQNKPPTLIIPPTPLAQDLDRRFSLGERVLVTANQTSEKLAATEAFGKQDYATTIAKLKLSLQAEHNDPEALIYLNNAQAAERGKYYRVAVTTPIGGNRGVALEILRGVAQAQDEVNRRGGLDGHLLQVQIVNDDNNPALAAQAIAPRLIEDPAILAVIGHNASEVSLQAAPVYQKGGLVMMSPTSGAKELSGLGDYIFRTVPSVKIDAANLSRYALKTARKTKFAACVDSLSPYSTSIQQEFFEAVLQDGGLVSKVPCDLSDPTFNPETFLSQAIADGADGLLLTPSVERVNQGIELAKRAKGRMALFGGSTIYMFQTLNLCRADCNGMVLAIVWHPSDAPSQSYVTQATKLWGGAGNWRTAMAYDATMAIVKALETSSTRIQLQRALRDPNFVTTGASGRIQFLPSGDRKREPGVGILVQIRPDPKSPIGYNFVPIQP
ncbi:hypothetical protein BST81_11615 [Leptolyngbya sp. 'hensonii']|uniref:ABC transporter substrate-binding protein n=1 Tax=Leptolyngbya sp. 'hensonii' TaxID=1922337 RepID=UPI00094F7AB7|nr:ABC transporter substrate-binding protein [Leptolyngbya sp. 'hensonii']OLP18255.1 hypothetical protein BST81_11615 [Leptolyngbya sp. 'hensonii']